MMHSPVRKAVGAAAVVTALLTGLSACSAAAPAPTETAGPNLFDQAAHDALPQSVQASGVLTVGLPTDMPPWATKPESEIVGIVPDLGAAVGEVLGVNVKLSGLAFPGLVPALQAGQIDAAWTVMTDTKDREGALDLVSYMRTSSDFLVKAGNPGKITGIDDSLCGKVIGTLRAALYLPGLEAQSAACTAAGKNPIQIDQYDDNKAAVLNVGSDKSDGFVGITGILRTVAAGSGGKFDVVGANLYPGYLGVATLPNSDVAKAIRLALVVLMDDGRYGEILAKYGSSSDAISSNQVFIDGITSGDLK